MRKRLLLAPALLLITAIAAHGETWNIDQSNSSIGFIAKHMVIASVRGQFDSYDGSVMFDGINPENGSAEVTIDVKSIDTNNERRDNHLRSSDFFEADKYPTITFKSTKITKTDENQFEMTGDLTIKGITKPVTFDCVFNGVIIDSRGNTRAGFDATGTIKRHDYNIAWDNKLKDGSFVVGENINIDIHTELVKAEAE
jgi:polyisoprenoid-binding protein YceI